MLPYPYNYINGIKLVLGLYT